MRIGELATRLGVNTKTIRYYEGIGLLPEAERTHAGYRIYTDADLGRLVFIKSAQRLGLSLDEVREVLSLRERGEPPCAYVRGVVQEQLRSVDSRIAELRTLRTELRQLEATANAIPVTTGATCRLIEHALPVGDTPTTRPPLRRSSRAEPAARQPETPRLC